MEKLTLTVVLGAAIGAGFKSVIGDANKSLSQLGETIRQTKSNLNSLGKLERLEADIGNKRKSLDAMRSTLSDLERKYQSSMAAGGTGTTKLTKEIDKAKNAIGKMEASISKTEMSASQLKSEMVRTGISFHDSAAEAQRLNQILQEQEAVYDRVKDRQNQRSTAMGKLRGEIAKLGSVIAFAGTATKTAIEFESAMADVRKVVDFDSPAQFKMMGDDIQRLSGRLPMAAEGIAAIVAAGGQAGVARSELLKFAEDATKMGVAFDSTAEESGQMMAQWRTAFRMSQDDVRGLADQINYLGNTGPASAAKISDIVTRIGPLGEVAGLASGQIAALGSTVAGMGIAPEIAATGIKNLMLTLNAGAAATKAQQTAFGTLGLDAKKLAIAMQKDAGGAIVDVLKRIQQLPKEAQSASLTKLFGKESVGAIAPLLNNLDLLKENLHKIGDASQYAGSMEKEYQSRAATSANNLQLLRNNFARLGTVIGNVFLPPVNAVVGSLSSLFSGVAEIAGEFPVLTTVVIAGATGWMTYKSAIAAAQLAMTYMPGSIGKVVASFPSLITSLPLVSTAMGATGNVMAAFSVSAGMGALALAPIVGLVIGVAAAGLLLYKYWEPVSAFFSGFFTGMMDGLAPLGQAFSAAFEPLISFVKPAFDWLMKLIEPLQMTTGELNGISSAGQLVGQVIGNLFRVLLAPIELTLKAIAGVGGAIKGLAGWLGFGGADKPATSSPKNTAAAALVAGAVAASPVGAAPAGSTKAAAPVSNTTNATITVQAAPGMDEKKLALEVRKQLEAKEREKASKNRSALYDTH